MPLIARTPPLIEALLLRRSVGALTAGRHRCVHCDRTPLIGERVYLYAAGTGERLVCELCRPLRREAPARTEIVHSGEHRRAVKQRTPRAA